MGSKVELFARIRRDARVEGPSIRALARRHGVGRLIVRLALDAAEPPPSRRSGWLPMPGQPRFPGCLRGLRRSRR
ncbi:hypothetical protein D7Z96_20820 [Pseudarthrobacter phenanthrenivorans]|uniref:Uncharacterized protein n=1 Tax=Pseudarthrobacter phenanthrenivorans TaxID=361575 RepID=A0A3B0FBL6_PSEPS|nr:hypothetical protein D7Z96_20820 [Pseudarthrobacter phenanthrenivorans]